MPRALLPLLNPDEQILLKRETGFRKRELLWLVLAAPVLWLILFSVMRFAAGVNGGGLSPAGTALFSGVMVMLGFMILTPLVWLMQRGRVWAVTNHRIIDNKGLNLPIARINRMGRRGAIFCNGITPFALPGVPATRLRDVLLPLLGASVEQFPSILPQSGLPQSGLREGLPHAPTRQGAAFWSAHLQPDEILIWSGQARRFWPGLLLLIITPVTAFVLFAMAQSIGLLECGRICPPAQHYVPGSALLVGAMIALLIWLCRPARYAITDRRVLVVATAMQRATRVGTGATELPLLGATFTVLPTEVWLSESPRGSATRFVAMMGLPRHQVKALERLLFALIRRAASQAYMSPPKP